MPNIQKILNEEIRRLAPKGNQERACKSEKIKIIN